MKHFSEIICKEIINILRFLKIYSLLSFKLIINYLKLNEGHIKKIGEILNKKMSHYK